MPASGETKLDIATAACVEDSGVALGSDLNILRSSLHGAFFSYFLNGSKRFDIAKLAQGDTVAHLYPNQLKKVEVAYPEPAEQQKIAACLGSLDELITAEAARLDALRRHKRGLMQQLFPAPGETQPRVRFPEFVGAGEWEEKRLGNIAEIKLGKMLNKTKHTTGHLLPYLNNVALRWNEVDTSDLPQMYFKDDELERYGLEQDDVVVCEGGEPGRACVWDGRLPNLKFQKAIHRVRFNVPFVPHMLVYYLEAIAESPYFAALFTGGGIKHLTRQTFAKLKIPVAPFEEQHRIATCLGSLDAQIAGQEERLAGLQAHKRGLMQGLFPEAEGR